jgi:ligand-binding sensor domain-containing protein/AraC-like DNA-binding protein
MLYTHHTYDNFYIKRTLLLLVSVLSTILLSAQSFATLTTEDGLMENFVTDIYQDTDGLMYLGTFRGVSRFDGQHVVNIPFRMKVENEINYITAIVAQDREHLLVGNGVGLWQLDKRHLTLTRVFDDDIDCSVTGMRVVAAKGSTPRKVIIETQFGVFALIDDHLQKISNRHCVMPVFGKVPTRGWGRFPMANNQFISPRDGSRWVSYNFFGVDYSYLNRGIFHVFERPGNIDTQQLALRNFLHDGTRLFFGTCLGLSVYDSATGVYSLVAPKQLGKSVIAQIMRTGNNYLVATVGQGLFVLDAHSLLPKTVFLPDANVYGLSSNGRGQVWINSSQGVGCYDAASGKLRLYNTHNSQLPSNEVFCIGVEPSGTAWISTAGGICQYRPDINAIVATGLPARLQQVGLLRSIEPLPKGRLMLIPQHGTARIYDVAANSLRTVALQGITDDRALLYLHFVNDTTFVFVTSDGIYVQQGKQLRKFGYIDGLSNQQFQSHAVVLDAHGILWAATNGGLVYAKLKDMLHHRFRPQRIILGQIQTDHWFSPEETTAVMMDGKLRLSRYRSDFTAQFSPVIYGRTSDIRYRYRLIGAADESWQTASHDHIIAFHHLAAGNYRLEIEAIGMPEIHTAIDVEVPLTYSAICFTMIVLLLLIFIGYVLYCKYRKIPYFWKMWERKPEHYQFSKLSPVTAKQLQKKLLEVMEKDKPYLNPTLQMSDLSKAVGCTSHELSQVFSQYLQRNYYDFIAEYRVREFKRRAPLPEYSKYTITALSELCGFRSRTPFLTAFKKFTGKTPKDYMKELGK